MEAFFVTHRNLNMAGRDVCKIACDGKFDEFRNLVIENDDLLTQIDEVSSILVK